MSTFRIRFDLSRLKLTEKALRRMAVPPRDAVDRGLARWAVAAHRAAHDLLGGSGAPGGMPVPVRTGHLRRSEDYVLPGRSKHGVSASSGMAVLINTAAYAHAVHEGTWTQRAHGTRPFQVMAVQSTEDAGMRAMAAEIRREVMP